MHCPTDGTSPVALGTTRAAGCMRPTSTTAGRLNYSDVVCRPRTLPVVVPIFCSERSELNGRLMERINIERQIPVHPRLEQQASSCAEDERSPGAASVLPTARSGIQIVIHEEVYCSRSIKAAQSIEDPTLIHSKSESW